MTADLASWLTAVWDEEERLAKACNAEPGVPLWPFGAHADPAPGVLVSRELVYVAGPGHPASVLARIAAYKEILALHAQAWDTSKDERAELYDHCATCWGPWPCATLKALAAPYADRPDAPEWLVERQGVEQ